MTGKASVMLSATRENIAVILMIFVVERIAVQRVPSAAGGTAIRRPVTVPVACARTWKNPAW